MTSRISRDDYDKFQSVYYDEVARLNPAPPSALGDDLKAASPDDHSVYASYEFRFMMFRHWNLYDAMYHSSYVASKLGIWKERGRKRLTGLLAKMGFSILETQQPFSHMAKDLKESLREKLDQLAPEYGLVELSYPSFMRCFGYRSQPLSAADAVEALSALLDIAGGTRIEVEVEGARNGGEWFGGGKLWEGGKEGRYHNDNRENVPPGVLANVVKAQVRAVDGKEGGEGEDVDWWVKNFWAAFNALSEYVCLALVHVKPEADQYLQRRATTRSHRALDVPSPSYYPPRLVDNRQAGYQDVARTSRRHPYPRPRPPALHPPGRPRSPSTLAG